jgi:hypothetical protein
MSALPSSAVTIGDSEITISGLTLSFANKASPANDVPVSLLDLVRKAS